MQLLHTGTLSSNLLSRLLAVTGTLLSTEAVCCRMLTYAGTLFSTLAVYCRMLTYAGTLFSALFSRLLAVTQPVTSGEISHAEAAEESVGTSSVSA